MNNQTAYDTVCHHLADMSKRSTRRAYSKVATWITDPKHPGTARASHYRVEGAYVANDGSRCAIGALLPEQMTVGQCAEIEGKGVSVIAETFPFLRDMDLDLLAELQQAHDDPSHWRRGVGFTRWNELVRIGETYGLDVSVSETYRRKLDES